MSVPSFGLAQTQRLTQILAPQMRQALHILEIPTQELRTEIIHEMQQNPLIESVSNGLEVPISSMENGEREKGDLSERELDFSNDKASAVLGADDGYRDYFMQGMENASSDEEAQTRRQRLFDRQHVEETLQSHLLKQIPLSDIRVSDRPLAEMLIGDIDGDGYYRGALPDLEMVTGASEKRLRAVLTHIVRFDPAGCGARSLQECLLAQLDKLDDSPWQNEVRKVILHHLEDVAARRIDAVCADLGISHADYEKVLKELQSLNPKPGLAFVSEKREARYVKPDVNVVKRDGKWVAEVDERILPEIHISQKYLDLLKDPKTAPATKDFIRQRLEKIHAIGEAIERRQDTIRRIAQEIIDAQPGFFEKGLLGLRPLTQAAIAQKVGLSAPTISRTVNNKYMGTPCGTVEMSRFFVNGIASDQGMVNTEAVKQRLAALIEGEDKSHPLSDDKIVSLLTAEGIQIARRTVAKYRKLLDIPTAGERRL